MAKYELVMDDMIEWYGLKFFRMRALRNFGVVVSGELGGYVTRGSSIGNADDDISWVRDDALFDGTLEGNSFVVTGSRVLGSVIRGGAVISALSRVEYSTISGNILVICSEIKGSHFRSNCDFEKHFVYSKLTNGYLEFLECEDEPEGGYDPLNSNQRFKVLEGGKC